MLNENQHENLILSKHYKCTDLGSASALLATGFTLINLDKANPSRAVFIFENSPQLQESLSNYWSGKLMIDAKSYFENTRWLKSRIYNG